MTDNGLQISAAALSEAAGAASGVAAASSAGLAAAGAAFGLIDGVLERVERVRARKLSAESWLRAYYFEVIGNVELLDALDFKKLGAVDVNSPGFRKIVSRIETEIGLSILFSEKIDPASDLFRLLKTKGKMENRGGALLVTRKGKETPFAGKTLYESVLQAVSFTVVKTEVLKKLSAFDADEREFMKGILLRRRLLNIRERFVMIKNAMDALEGIRELSR